MSIDVVQGDVIGWRVSVTEGGVAKNLTGATLSASIRMNGTVYPLATPSLAAANTAADVVVDTSDLPGPGAATLQCRFALGGEVRTAEQRLNVARSAFAA